MMLNVQELERTRQVKLPNAFMILAPGQSSKKKDDGTWENEIDISRPGIVILTGGKNKGKILMAYSDLLAIVSAVEEHKDFIQHNVNLERIQKLKEMKVMGTDIETLLVLAESWGLDKDEVRKFESVVH